MNTIPVRFLDIVLIGLAVLCMIAAIISAGGGFGHE